MNRLYKVFSKFRCAPGQMYNGLYIVNEFLPLPFLAFTTLHE